MYKRSATIRAVMAWAVFAALGWAYQSHEARDCEPVNGPFYLTGVPANGSATYPIFTAVESRGVQTLSSATSYFDQWTYNTSVQIRTPRRRKRLQANVTLGLITGSTSQGQTLVTPRSRQALQSSLGRGGGIMDSLMAMTASSLSLRMTPAIRILL